MHKSQRKWLKINFSYWLLFLLIKVWLTNCLPLDGATNLRILFTPCDTNGKSYIRSNLIFGNHHHLDSTRIFESIRLHAYQLCFRHIDWQTCQWPDPDRDQLYIRRITQLRDHNPNLHILIAIGGWGDGSTKYSLIARSPTTRRIFIESVLDFLRRYDLDGIDIDWWESGKRVLKESRGKVHRSNRKVLPSSSNCWMMSS